MIVARHLALALSLSALAAPVTPAARAQPAGIPQLRYEPDLTIPAREHLIRSSALFAVSRRGVIVVPAAMSGEPLRAFTPDGKRLEWKTRARRGEDREFITVVQMGWIGDSLWVEDRIWDHAVVLDTAGVVVKSYERPSWIRPRWRDRRKYPLFSDMYWRAIYPDGTMLVVPQQPRALFDTPDFDRGSTHLLRVDADGVIQRTIARVPSADARMLLRDGQRRWWINVPFFPRTHWQVSADGRRIAVASPLVTASDSGAFVVTLLDENGDTMFTRRYVSPTARLTPATVDSVLRKVAAFGRYSAESIRDTLRKQIPAYLSPVQGVDVGVDHSVWVWVRPRDPTVRDRIALVLDSLGTVVGTATLPRTLQVPVYSVDHVWGVQISEVNSRERDVVRLRRTPPREALEKRQLEAR